MAADRRDLRRSLSRLAADQSGYFSAAQAKELGYSYQAQGYHVRAANWNRIDRGLFRLPEALPGPHDDLVRWTLWSKGQAIVSHESALAVHEIGELESGRIHLTVPSGFTKRDPAVVIHHAELPDDDVLAMAGFRVTTLIRSLVDVAGTGSDEDQLARAIEEGLGTGTFTLRQLRAKAEEVDIRSALHIERAAQAVTVP